MNVQRIFFLFLLSPFLLISVQSQTLLRGISNWKTTEIRAYSVTDFVTETEVEIGRAKVDSDSIFEFKFLTNGIEKVILRGANYYAWLYIQPKSTYFIELPEPTEYVSSMERDKEVEMLFYRLDSTDVNYKILGFEAWMDESIAEIYQLKDVHPEQFIAKVRSFKQETAFVYKNLESPFFFNYVKYSVGLSVDNFNIIGGPSKQDKFDFYLSEDSIQYKNPKFIEYAELFYEKYLYQLDKNIKIKVELALRKGSLEELISALMEDTYIQTRSRAEFVTLLLFKEAYYQGYLDRPLIYDLLSALKKESSINEHQRIANELLSLFKQMQIGMQAPDYVLSTSKHFYQYKDKWVYLHVFDPSNERCITEISALKKLELTYGKSFQFVTIYPSKVSYTKSEQRNLDALTWDTFPIDQNHEIWKSLQLSSYPMYMLFDSNLVLHSSPALSPTPNGKYETIEKVFRTLERP
jgi:hypothetical protein